MAGDRLICGTGPLVAFLNRGEQFDHWAGDQFERFTHPLETCEAVVSEAVFPLHEDGQPADPVFEAIERNQLLVQFTAGEHWPDLRRPIRKYRNLPMSLADACLVRISELAPHRQM